MGLVSGTLQPTATLAQARLCLIFLLWLTPPVNLSDFCSPCQGGPMCPPPQQPPRPERASVTPHFTSCPFVCLLDVGHPPRLSLLLSGCLSSLLWALHTKFLWLPVGWVKGELLMKDGSSCQGLRSTLCQPFPCPHLYLSNQLLARQLLLTHHPSLHFLTGDGRRVLSLFHQKNLQDFDTLLLSADGSTLYVGAREAILALNIQDPGVPRLRNMVRRPWLKGVGWE